MEYFEYGDLSKHMDSICDEEEVRQITTDLLEGLSIMHGEQFAHRDLKPQNIFVVEKTPKSPRWWVKIGDFGISKRVKNEETAWHTQTGTPHFQAPEIRGFIDDGQTSFRYDKSVDIWSLGCVIYNISAQRLPFARPSELNNYCREGIEFVERLLTPEPSRRITIGIALEDSWIVRKQVSVVTYNNLENSSIQDLRQAKDDEKLRALSSGSYAHKPSRLVGSLISDEQNVFIPQSQISSWQSRNPEGRTTIFTPIHSLDPFDSQVSMSKTAIAHTEPSRIMQNPLESRSELIEPTKKVKNRISTQDPPNTPIVAHEPDKVTSRSITDTSKPAVDHADGPVRLSISLNPGNWITTIAFSTDGSLLALGSTEHSVELWDVATRQRCSRPWYHPGKVRTLAFAPYFKRLIASGSDDEKIRLWDMESDSTYRELLGHTKAINTVNFLKCGGWLISGSDDTTIRLWDLRTGKTLHTFNEHSDSVCCAVISPDASWIASGSRDNTIRVWSVDSGQVVCDSWSPRDTVGVLAFSPKGDKLYSGSQNGSIKCLKPGTLMSKIAFSFNSPVVALDILQEPGLHSMAWSSGNDVILGNPFSQRALYRFFGHRSPVTAARFSPYGQLLASSSEDGTLLLWELWRLDWLPSPSWAQKLKTNELLEGEESLS